MASSQGAWPAPHVLECRQVAQLGAASGRMVACAALTGRPGRGSVHLWLVPQILHSAVRAFGVLQVQNVKVRGVKCCGERLMVVRCRLCVLWLWLGLSVGLRFESPQCAA